MNLASLSSPAPIDPSHALDAFDCGESSLNHWLGKRALKNDRSGASRTYVVCEGQKVAGYYCLSAGAIVHGEAPKELRRNMPDPIPVMVLGRLAVDLHYQQKGLGKALLLDATRRTLQAAEISGIVALLVHALSEQARRFYFSCGFVESPVKPMTLCLLLKAVHKALADKPV